MGQSILYVEPASPTYGYRRLDPTSKIDLLIHPSSDGCFEEDRREGRVRDIFSHDPCPGKIRLAYCLLKQFWSLRKKRYDTVFFPINRRIIVFMAFRFIVRSQNLIRYDPEKNWIEAPRFQPKIFRSIAIYVLKWVETALLAPVHLMLWLYLFFQKR